MSTRAAPLLHPLLLLIAPRCAIYVYIARTATTCQSVREPLSLLLGVIDMQLRLVRPAPGSPALFPSRSLVALLPLIFAFFSEKKARLGALPFFLAFFHSSRQRGRPFFRRGLRARRRAAPMPRGDRPRAKSPPTRRLIIKLTFFQGAPDCLA